MLNPVAMSIITNTFPDPRERAQAVGVWGAVFGVPTARCILGGGLLYRLARHLRHQPPDRDRRDHPHPAVHPGIQGPQAPPVRPRRPGARDHHARDAHLRDHRSTQPRLGTPLILAPLTTSAAALAALIVYEPRRRDPLIDLRFFRSIPFSTSIVTSTAVFCAFGGFLFLNTLYLQDVRVLPDHRRPTRPSRWPR